MVIYRIVQTAIGVTGSISGLVYLSEACGHMRRLGFRVWLVGVERQVENALDDNALDEEPA